MEMVNDSLDEDYVIQKAKDALQTDPIFAKSWMITAKTLYPTNFGVQVGYVYVSCILVYPLKIVNGFLNVFANVKWYF